MKRTIGTPKRRNCRNCWPEVMKFYKRRIMVQRALMAIIRANIPKDMLATDITRCFKRRRLNKIKRQFRERWCYKYPTAFAIPKIWRPDDISKDIASQYKPRE